MKGQRKSPIVKRSIEIDGRKTSVSLEDAFWDAFRDVAKTRGTTPAMLASSINRVRQNSNLSSAVRVFVVDHYRSNINKEGARRRSRLHIA